MFPMKRPWLFVAVLTMACWALAAGLEPWFQSWEGNRAGSGNLLQIALGDGRKLFARQVYTKADAYFHNGYYPSIFDEAKEFEGAHINKAVGLTQAEEKELDFYGAPRDWIDAFGRKFFPSVHRHLGESDCDHDHGHEGECDHDHDHGHEDHGDDHNEHGEESRNDGRAAGLEREILPWLRLSVELDPEQVETYVVGAYWLRNKLNKVGEAEAFLREGLRTNPLHPQLLFELGRIYREDREDLTRTRNVWELALRKLDEMEQNMAEPNVFLRAQILGNLARLEEESGHYARAVEHLTKLEVISPHAGRIRQWIVELRAAEQAQ